MKKNQGLLIFIPTYNEINNVEQILNNILALEIDAHILFMDDCSPDGTGVLLDRLVKVNSNLIVRHRPSKLGIGSAHRDGIQWAYEKGYRYLLTLDCDATHPPQYIPDFLQKISDFDVVVGSRHLRKSSLVDWNLKRKFLTKLGHWLTFYCLDIPYDATGSFRLYDLQNIPQSFLDKVRSKGYSFFFETLFILHRNQFRIAEVAIHLPSRINDRSKMKYSDIFGSLYLLLILFLEKNFTPRKFKISRK